MRSAWVMLAAATVAVTGLHGTVASQAAPTATVKVCVNKKSGKVTHLRKGTCRKGWKKVSWSKSGPRGNPGVAGTPGERGSSGGLSLYANGERVGPAIGSMSPEIYFPVALRDGGVYSYLPDGTLYPNTESPHFFTADCSGAAYMVSSQEISAQLIAGWAGSSVRLVARTTSPALGAVQGVWTPSGQVTALPGGGENMYRLLSDGTCFGPSVQTGWTSTLTAVTPPANLTPPLTIR